MDLQHNHVQDLSSCNFHFNQPNKLLVLMHIIFSLHTCSGSQTISELCILTIKFIYSKRKYHSLHMHYFSIPSLSKCNQTSNEFNQCANIHGHIHTQCTLALIFRLLLFILGTFPWWVGTQPTFYHMVLYTHLFLQQDCVFLLQLIMTSNQHT
jgi:hypothetical protein